MTSRLTRWGQAVVAPRHALTLADRAGIGGAPAVDLAWAVLLVVVAGYTRGLVATGWVGLELGLRAAMAPLTMTLTAAATVPLATVAVATIAIWLGAGRRRDLGRDADLACVVAMSPTLTVIVTTTVGAWIGLPRTLLLGVAGAAAVVPTIVAVQVARRRAPARDDTALGSARGAGPLVAGVAAVCLAANLGWVAANLDRLRPLVTGQPAPALVLPRIDEAGAPTGPAVDLATLRGRVVVVEFWATWCKPCLASLPVIDGAARRWGDRVTVLAVNVDDAAKARALFRARGYQLTLVADQDDASERWMVHTLPHAVVVDGAGVVRTVSSQPREIEAAVERLLASPR